MFKIVQMVPALGWGGAQIFCIQLCNELAKYPNYEVTLVSMYHHKPESHLPLNFIDKKVKFITLGKKPGLDYKMFTAINQLLKEIKPDVVHTHLHTGFYCFLAYLTAKDRSFKKIHTFHSLVTKDSPWHGRQAFKYFFSNNIIIPVSISEEVFKSAREEYGKSIKTLINNGSVPVSPSPAYQEVADKINSFKKDANTKVFLNVARINKTKNQQLLLACMKTLEEENANVIAVILGDYIPEDKKFYDMLMQNKPANVHFMGKVTNVGDYYLNTDVFALTSLYEGLPISLLEALSAGAVPVCTPVGGIINLVNNDIGYLSEDLTYEKYLAALRAYLAADQDTIERLKTNGKELYRREFSMETCAAKYDVLYHS